MRLENQNESKKMLWAGYIISGLFGLMLVLDGIAKFFKPRAVIEGTVRLGYPEATIIPLGIILTASALIYLFPKTAVLGAVLLTGYLGGAVATHLRAGDPLFNIIFPAILGMLLWLGIYLRDSRLRALLPFRT